MKAVDRGPCQLVVANSMQQDRSTVGGRSRIVYWILRDSFACIPQRNLFCSVGSVGDKISTH